MATTTTMRPNNLPPPPPTNKRKRDSIDHHDASRPLKSQNTNGEADDSTAEELAAMQMLQGLVHDEEDDHTRTAQAALATPMQHSTYPPPEASYESATGMPHGMSSFDDPSNSPPTGFSAISPSTQALMAARDGATMNHNKPAVGTAQWHQQRKDNHKEVERRRRETINEGINELAKVVPGSEKNKGAILQSAVAYIGELMSKAHSWDNERATFDIAIKELANRTDKMKESAEQAWAEAAKWQKRCRDARLPYDDYDDGALPELSGLVDEDGLDV